MENLYAVIFYLKDNIFLSVSLIFAFAVFLVAFIVFRIFCKTNGKIFYLIISVLTYMGVIAVNCGLTFCAELAACLIITVLFNVIFFLCFFIKKSNKYVLSQSQKELISFLDNSVKRINPESENTNTVNGEELERKIVCEKREDKGEELNLSHVKKIIEKLSYFPLSQVDKRQVIDIETSIYQLERDKSDLAKIRVNESLSELLKIMAKYGV